MVKLHSFFGLIQGILVTVNLRKNRAELHLKPCDYYKLSHTIADRLFFEIDAVSW
jgi:hypothetical protein